MSGLIYKRVINLLVALVTYCFYCDKYSSTIEWE
jgi:hypothetical protein